MTKNPCYKCDRRQIGCHSKCELYSEWQDIHNKEKAFIESKVNFEKDYNRYKKEVCKRSKKNGRKH